ncbi:MAG: hypothetical protein WC303_03130 [Candidatus Paceibacterota bacterium]
METKYCYKCKCDKSINDFHKNPTKKDGLQTMCKDCRKKYHKNHYDCNKEIYKDKAKKYKKSIMEWFIEIKKDLKCSKCGEDRYWILDFHHINPNEKDIDVSSLLNTANKKRILNEIKKCTVYCANCHRDLHFQERQNNAGDA